jgi:hypothetical protein
MFQVPGGASLLRPAVVVYPLGSDSYVVPLMLTLSLEALMRL